MEPDAAKRYTEYRTICQHVDPVLVSRIFKVLQREGVSSFVELRLQADRADQASIVCRFYLGQVPSHEGWGSPAHQYDEGVIAARAFCNGFLAACGLKNDARDTV